MQALLICCSIIAVLLYIIGIYAIYILYKMNKLGQSSKEQQTEFLSHHSKLFIGLTIISIVLTIILFVGYALLVTQYDTEQISEYYLFFIMFSCFLSMVSIITFITGCVAPKWRNRNNNCSSKSHIEKAISDTTITVDTDLEQEQTDTEITSSDDLVTVEKLSILCQQLAQERLDIEKNHNLSYFKENNPALIKKYASAVNNFIKKVLEEVGCPFLDMFKDSEIPLSSILIYPYRNSASQLLKDKIKHDGLEFTYSSNEELNNKIWKLTDFFVAGLKKRIKDNNEWQDEYTLSALLYMVVRNNLIKFYHDEYIKQIGYLSLEEFCENSANTIKANIVAYSYYYIYETNIDLPFVNSYLDICRNIEQITVKQRERKLENDLFGTPKKQPKLADDNKTNNLSPIERVDLMTGEEFEIFMEHYFSQKGYKVKRTPLSGDYGVDLIIEHELGGKIGVQLKCYSKKVPADAVQEVSASLQHYKLSSGMVITNNYFQPSAIRLAADNNITLWDRDKLIEKLEN